MKKDFFSGWTAFFSILAAVFIFIFAFQYIMDNFRFDSGGTTNNKLPEGISQDSKITERKGVASEKKLSELTENIAKSTNLSDEEKRAIVEQKLSEGAQSVSEGDFQAALKTYNELVEFNPNDENLRKDRGDVYQNLKNYAGAIEDYDAAIQLNSDFAIAYCSRGESYIKLGKYDQAIADLTKAAELKPDYSEAYKNLAICYRALGDEEKAQIFSEKAK